jgi:Glycosyltransferase family 87
MWVERRSRRGGVGRAPSWGNRPLSPQRRGRWRGSGARAACAVREHLLLLALSVSLPTVRRERAGLPRGLFPSLSRRGARVAGIAGMATAFVAGALIALGSPSPDSGVVAGGRHLAGRRESALEPLAWPLTHDLFLVLLLVMTAGYLLAVLGARGLRARWALGAVVVLQVLFALAPPLLSTDVFSYVNYARLGAVHGLNPYVHTPMAVPGDPSFTLAGHIWKHTPTTYGPLFTLLGYPLARVGVAASVWGEKALAAAASLACVAAVWGCARAAGRAALPAALLVGLNPILVVYGVGGAHNDLLMLALLMAGVLLVLRGRDASGAAAVVAACAVKATAVILLPFLLLGRRARWRATIGGLVAAGLAIGLVDLVAFGTGSAQLVTSLRGQQSLVSYDAFPTLVAHLIGLRGVFPIDRLLLRIAFALVLLVLLWAAWRGLDWVTAGGWALTALVVSSTWMQAWYIVWPLPLAAVARDRRLVAAVLLLEGLFIATQIGPLLA